MIDFKFTPASHEPTPSFDKDFGLTHNGIIGMRGQAHIPMEAWYNRKMYKRGISKIMGATLDRRWTINSSGIWNHRNSVRIGYEPDLIAGFFELYLYLHIDGKPLVPKPIGSIKLGTVVDTRPFDWSWYIKDKTIYATAQWTTLDGKTHFFHQNFPYGDRPIEKGYYLYPYHGGRLYPLEIFTMKAKTLEIIKL